MDRSRSPPRRNSKEWIAKQIVRFGRYAENRPRGLSVDGAGGFLLSKLMKVWGEDEGLEPKKVLDALEINHMRAGGGIRFSVDRLGEDWEITVHPRHGQDGHDTGSRNGFRPRPTHSREVHENLSTKDKMGMGLDDIIKTGTHGSSSRDHYRPSSSNRAAGSSKAVEMIDLEDENFDLASLASLAPSESQRFASTGWARRRAYDERSDRRDSGPMDQQSQSHKIKVSKFVSYIIKKGHDELGIDLWQEYADLNDLVRVINQKRVYGEYTLQELKNTLQDTDDVGRFQYWKDWVRKVDRTVREGGKASSRPDGMEVDAGSQGTAPPAGPPKPPGDNWTQYTDEGQDKTWWYYEGPLGKWWCDDDDSVPRVWNFED